MNNLVLSTRDIDSFIGDIANEVVSRIHTLNLDAPVGAESKYDTLNVREASVFLETSQSVLRGRIARREVPFHKIGSRIHFVRKELEEFENEKSGNVQNPAQYDGQAVLSKSQILSITKKLEIFGRNEGLTKKGFMQLVQKELTALNL